MKMSCDTTWNRQNKKYLACQLILAVWSKWVAVTPLNNRKQAPPRAAFWTD